MLTTAQKASILLRNGVVVPELAADAVNDLFDDYVASRAARSLQEAEEARQLDLLSRLAATSYQRRRVTHYA
ncbi:MAG: hypothetical protein EOP82_26405 [Variovorax sp.]|nr:MAG: hypothetical protein EOP82_26405 [Variovorax sp.]